MPTSKDPINISLKTKSLECIKRLKFACKSLKTQGWQESKFSLRTRKVKVSSLRMIHSSSSLKVPVLSGRWLCLQVVSSQLIELLRWRWGKILDLILVWARSNRNWRCLTTVGHNLCGNTKRSTEIVILPWKPITILLEQTSKKDNSFLLTKLERSQQRLSIDLYPEANWESVLCVQ